MDVRFNLVASEQLLGALKATGSTDRDVLFAAKEEYAARYRPMKWFGWALLTGGVSSLLVFLAFIGIPLLGLGWWWVRRYQQNMERIEHTYERYVTDIMARTSPPDVTPMRAVG